jgi:hypothetical protein
MIPLQINQIRQVNKEQCGGFAALGLDLVVFVDAAGDKLKQQANSSEANPEMLSEIWVPPRRWLPEHLPTRSDHGYTPRLGSLTAVPLPVANGPSHSAGGAR